MVRSDTSEKGRISMAAFNLITDDELAQFNAALKRNGWEERDFELQGEDLDQAKAEVETRTGRWA